MFALALSPRGVGVGQPMTPDQSRLLELIPTGRRNATSMSGLATQMGRSDREIRRLCKELTKAGYPVCSLPLPRGVWRPESYQEALEAAKQLRSRGLACLESSSDLERAALDLWQPVLFVEA